MIESSASAATISEVELQRTQFKISPSPDRPFALAEEAEVIQAKGEPSVVFSATIASDPSSERARTALDDLVSRARRDLVRHPSSLAAMTNLGLVLLNQGQVVEAIEPLGEVLKRDPEHYVALANMARAEFIRGNLDVAEELLRRAFKLQPGDASVLLSLAALLRRRGDKKAALELQDKAARDNPSATAVQYELGMGLLSQHRYREALSHLKIAARTNVRSPAVHHALGVGYALAGDLRRARRSLQAALSLSPLRTESVNALAHVLITEKLYHEAIELLTGHTADGDIDSRELLALANYNARRFAASKVQFSRLVQELKGAPDTSRETIARALNNLGLSLLKLGEQDGAEAALMEAIDVAPMQSPIPYHNLVALYARQRKSERLEELLTTCASAFPGDAMTQWLLALATADSGRADLAIERLKIFERERRDSPEVSAVLGGLLADERGDFDGALAILMNARERFSGNVRVANNVAYVLLLSGNAEEAREVIASVPDHRVSVDDRITWTATKGLLAIVEDDLREGQRLYRLAISLARQQDNAALAEVVLQKMHLELAKALARRGSLDAARAHIRSGLQVKGRLAFRRGLQKLRDAIGGE
jgi:Flp pilus assembly protein TadD